MKEKTISRRNFIRTPARKEAFSSIAPPIKDGRTNLASEPGIEVSHSFVEP